MKQIKAYDKEHFNIFKVKKVFDIISIDFRSKSVLLDAGKYGDIKRTFAQVDFIRNSEKVDLLGNEIYEGDLLTFDYLDHEDIDKEKYKTKPTYIVKFEDGMWAGIGIKKNDIGQLYCHSFRFKNTEILGNIYENSDLLS